MSVVIPAPACEIPPAGWVCTRKPGHDGPCAAVPEDTMIPPAKSNMDLAWDLTHGNRKSSYGDVRVAFERYAKVWSGLLGAKLREDLTASDVALLMTGLKLAREMNKQQSDNIVDAHGYLILHDEIKDESR